ncbi:hypothetical protein ACYATP_07980 [Lactobacillaceae bacterium Melli_B4]
MSEFTQLKKDVSNNTNPDQYVSAAAKYISQFQIDHHGVLSNDYLASLNQHYATATQIINCLALFNISINFNNEQNGSFYKIILDDSNVPMNLDSITKNDVNNIHVVPVDQDDKSVVFEIIDNMVEEYLDETDSVHL